MDAAARKALGHLIRTELVADFERVAAELERLDGIAAELEELRHRLQLVEQETGLQIRGPRDTHTRRLAVIALRRRGYSLRKIEVLLGVARGTIEKDLRAAGVSLPPGAVGVDGKPIGRRAQNGRAPG